jgi:hypothetical protein
MASDEIIAPIKSSKLPPKFPPMGGAKKGKKTKTATGQPATPVSIGVNIYEGEEPRTAVVSWGRMNPPTIGHEKLVNEVKALAESREATPLVFVSQTQDAKRNPLLYEDKIRFAQIAFGDVVQHAPHIKNLVEMLQDVNKSHNRLIMVVGEDRVEELGERLLALNGEHIFFESIEIYSAGGRDTLAEGAEGASGSKSRMLVAEGNFDDFVKTLPKNLWLFAEEIYALTRLGLQLEATLEKENLLSEALSPIERIKRGQVMHRFAGKIERARELSMSRRATNNRLVSRARHHAILIMRQKLAGKMGGSYSELPASVKTMIDTRIAKARSAVIRLSLKILPQVKKLEYSRMGGKKKARMNEAEVVEMVSTLLDQSDDK